MRTLPQTNDSPCSYSGHTFSTPPLSRTHHKCTLHARPQTPPPPSQLAARVRCLQAVAAQLHPALGFDLAPDVFEALLLHCQPEPYSDAYPLDGAAAGACMRMGVGGMHAWGCCMHGALHAWGCMERTLS
jgi:hypothetical protein